MSTRTQRILWDMAPAQPTRQPDPRCIGINATMCAAGAMCPGHPIFFKFDAQVGQVLAWCERHVPADAQMTAGERCKIRARRGQPEPHNPRYCSCVACLTILKGN